jgi:hypothetical protein
MNETKASFRTISFCPLIVIHQGPGEIPLDGYTSELRLVHLLKVVTIVIGPSGIRKKTTFCGEVRAKRHAVLGYIDPL